MDLNSTDGAGGSKDSDVTSSGEVSAGIEDRGGGGGSGCGKGGRSSRNLFGRRRDLAGRPDGRYSGRGGGVGEFACCQ